MDNSLREESEKGMKDHTFIIIKPNAVKRSLIGKIIARIENKGLKIIALKLLRLTRSQAENLYEMHRNKPFFGYLINHITSDLIVAMVIEGEEAIKVMRKMVGTTNPTEAAFGTIRGDFGLSITENIIHAADNEENTLREMKICFTSEEILS